jgi:AcrR family transcriptional regulator
MIEAQKLDEGLRRATIEVLRERSFSGLTLERVAEVAGRARSTLWRQGHSRETLIGALVNELAEDFRATMYPILTAEGTGLERLTRGLEALCDLIDRHLPLMLATDEAFHQDAAPETPSYLHPFIQFLREGARDGSLPEPEDVVRTADLAFNMTAWPYVHLRGRHEWPADEAAACVVAVVLHGIADRRKDPS